MVPLKMDGTRNAMTTFDSKAHLDNAHSDPGPSPPWEVTSTLLPRGSSELAHMRCNRMGRTFSR